MLYTGNHKAGFSETLHFNQPSWGNAAPAVKPVTVCPSALPSPLNLGLFPALCTKNLPFKMVLLQCFIQVKVLPVISCPAAVLKSLQSWDLSTLLL